MRLCVEGMRSMGGGGGGGAIGRWSEGRMCGDSVPSGVVLCGLCWATLVVTLHSRQGLLPLFSFDT